MAHARRARRNLVLFWVVLIGLPAAAVLAVGIVGAIALSNPAYN